MLEVIFSWLFKTLGEGIDAWLTNLVGDGDADGVLALNLTNLTSGFPMFATLYEILQGVAIGLIALIGGFGLFKFITGFNDEQRDTPVSILIRSGIAAMLVYFGNYVVDALIQIANAPYTKIWNTKVGTSTSSVKSLADAICTNVLEDQVGGLLSLIFLLIIAWNLLKVIVEIFERLFMVGVLTYTSPLVYATFASSATSQIFKKWSSMLIGQLVLMSLSAWSLKIILASMANAASLPGFLFLLAACRIAQRIDTYMQQLGLNTVTTGGGLMSDIMGAVGVGASAIGLARRAGGSKGTPLGGNAGNGGAQAPKSSYLGGPLGGIVSGARKGAFVAANGGSMQDAMKAAGKGFVKGLDPTQRFRENAAQKKQNTALAKEAAAAGMGGAIRAAGRNTNSAVAANKNGPDAEGVSTFSREFAQKAHSNGVKPADMAKENLAAQGAGGFVIDPNGNVAKDQSGIPLLDQKAKDAGLSIQNGQLCGPEASRQEFLSKQNMRNITDDDANAIISDGYKNLGVAGSVGAVFSNHNGMGGSISEADQNTRVGEMGKEEYQDLQKEKIGLQTWNSMTPEQQVVAREQYDRLHPQGEHFNDLKDPAAIREAKGSMGYGFYESMEEGTQKSTLRQNGVKEAEQFRTDNASLRERSDAAGIMLDREAWNNMTPTQQQAHIGDYESVHGTGSFAALSSAERQSYQDEWGHKHLESTIGESGFAKQYNDQHDGTALYRTAYDAMPADTSSPKAEAYFEENKINATEATNQYVQSLKGRDDDAAKKELEKWHDATREDWLAAKAEIGKEYYEGTDAGKRSKIHQAYAASDQNTAFMQDVWNQMPEEMQQQHITEYERTHGENSYSGMSHSEQTQFQRAMGQQHYDKMSMGEKETAFLEHQGRSYGSEGYTFGTGNYGSYIKPNDSRDEGIMTESARQLNEEANRAYHDRAEKSIDSAYIREKVYTDGASKTIEAVDESIHTAFDEALERHGIPNDVFYSDLHRDVSPDGGRVVSFVGTTPTGEKTQYIIGDNLASTTKPEFSKVETLDYSGLGTSSGQNGVAQKAEAGVINIDGENFTVIRKPISRSTEREDKKPNATNEFFKKAATYSPNVPTGRKQPKTTPKSRRGKW